MGSRLGVFTSIGGAMLLLGACAPERAATSLQEMIDACRRLRSPDDVRAYARQYRLPAVPPAQSHEARLQGSWAGPNGTQLHVVDPPRRSEERAYEGFGCVVTGHTRDTGALIEAIAARAGGVRFSRVSVYEGPRGAERMIPLQLHVSAGSWGVDEGLELTFASSLPQVTLGPSPAALTAADRHALSVSSHVRFSSRHPQGPFEF